MDSSMDTDSETVMVINKSEAVGFDTPKRERYMKTPSQLDALEAAFTGIYLHVILIVYDFECICRLFSCFCLLYILIGAL